MPQSIKYVNKIVWFYKNLKIYYQIFVCKNCMLFRLVFKHCFIHSFYSFFHTAIRAHIIRALPNEFVKIINNIINKYAKAYKRPSLYVRLSKHTQYSSINEKFETLIITSWEADQLSMLKPWLAVNVRNQWRKAYTTSMKILKVGRMFKILSYDTIRY